MMIVIRYHFNRYKSQGKHNGHGPHDASKEKFVSMVSFARSMSQVMAGDRPHSPETARQRWERDYDERMRRLENDLSQNTLWSARGGNKRSNSAQVKRQYTEAKAAFKGIHRLSSLAFVPMETESDRKNSVDTTTTKS